MNIYGWTVYGIDAPYAIGVILNIILVIICFKTKAIHPRPDRYIMVAFFTLLSLVGTIFFLTTLAGKKWPRLLDVLAPERVHERRMVGNKAKLRGALQQILDDMANAQEEKSLWSSAVYDSVANAERVLEETK
jgi:hypothetical protein